MRDYAELVKGLRDCSRRNARVCMICGAKASNLCEGTKSKRMFYAADAIEELLAEKLAYWVDTQPHMDDSNYKKDGMSYYCSACGHRAGKYKHRTYKFCPWCGAKIVEKGDTNDRQSFIHG